MIVTRKILWPLILLTMLASGIPSARGNDFTDWLLGKTQWGSADCNWQGCKCCDDYCGKAAPCTPTIPTCCPDNYCKKPCPCITELCPQVCPDYCPKPWPCLWKPMCGPFNWCGPPPVPAPCDCQK